MFIPNDNNPAPVGNTREQHLQQVVDSLNSLYGSSPVSFRIESAPSAVVGAAKEAKKTGRRPTVKKPDLAIQNQPMNLVIRRKVGEDQYKETYFSIDAAHVNVQDPETAQMTQAPVMMLNKTIIPSTVYVNNDQLVANPPRIRVGENQWKMTGGNARYYLNPIQSTVNAIRKTIGDPEKVEDVKQSDYHKRFQEITAHLPGKTDLDYLGLSDLESRSKGMHGVVSYVQFEKGDAITPSQWRELTNKLPEMGWGIGAEGSTHSQFRSKEESDRKKRNKTVVLARGLPVVYRSALPGITRAEPEGVLNTSYKASNISGKKTQDELVQKGADGSKKRENLGERSGFAPDNVVPLYIPDPTGQTRGTEGHLGMMVVPVKRTAPGGVDEAGNPITNESGNPVRQIVYMDPGGAGQSISSEGTFNLRGKIAVADEAWKVPMDAGWDIRSLRIADGAGRGQTIPSRGGTIINWGKGFYGSQGEDSGRDEQFSESGYKGGVLMMEHAFSFGNDVDSAQQIVDLLGKKNNKSVKSIADLLANPASRDPNDTSGRYAERERLERAAIEELNALQLDREYRDIDNKVIDPSASPAEYAAARKKAEERYRFVWAGPGGKGGRSAVVSQTAYWGTIDSYKTLDTKTMHGHIPTQKKARKILIDVERRQRSGGTVSVDEINNKVLPALAALGEEGEKFQEVSGWALQILLANQLRVEMFDNAKYRVGGKKDDTDTREIAPEIPVSVTSPDDVKNAAPFHLGTLAAIWNIGENKMGGHSPLSGGGADPYGLKRAYQHLRREFKSLDEIASNADGMVEKRQKVFNDILQYFPEYGDRLIIPVFRTHANVEPLGTRNTVNRVMAKDILTLAPEMKKAIYKEKETRASSIVSMLIPEANEYIDITQEDLNAVEIPMSGSSEQIDRFTAIKKLYDTARKKKEKETGTKIKKTASMRIAVPVKEGEDPRYIHIASPHSLRNQERSDIGTTYTRLVEWFQDKTRRGIAGESWGSLKRQYDEAVVSYVESDSGQKELANFAGPLMGGAYRYQANKAVESGTMWVGGDMIEAVAAHFKLPTKKFIKRLQSGEKFFMFYQRYPQARGSMNAAEIKYVPDYRGTIALPEEADAQNTGDGDGDLAGFVPGFKAVTTVGKSGKKRTRFVAMDGVDPAMARLGQSAAGALTRFAAIYGAEDFKDRVTRARGVMDNYINNELVGDAEWMKGFQERHGSIDPVNHPEAWADAMKKERDAMVVEALVKGFHEVSPTTKRGYRIDAMDAIFAGKNQRIGEDIEENAVEIKSDGSTTKSEKIGFLGRIINAVTYRQKPDHAGAKALEEAQQKKAMGIYTPVSALQSVIALNSDHTDALNEVVEEDVSLLTKADKEQTENVLKDLTSSVNVGGNVYSDHDEQAMISIGFAYQRALDLLDKPKEFERFNLDFFSVDASSGKWNLQGDMKNPDIVKNAVLAFTQMDEITPSAMAAMFAEMGNKEHIQHVYEASKRLKEKIRLRNQDKKAKKMTSEEILEDEDFKAIMEGGGKNVISTKNAFNRVMDITAYNNTMAKVEDNEYDEVSIVEKKHINDSLDAFERKMETVQSLEEGPNQGVDDLRTAYLQVTGSQRRRNDAGYAEAAIHDSPGVDPALRDLSQSDVRTIMGKRSRIVLKPGKAEAESEKEILAAFLKIGGIFDDHWYKQIYGEEESAASDNPEIRYLYRRMIGAPEGRNAKQSRSFEDIRRGWKTRPSQYGGIAEYDHEKANEYKFGARGVDVYKLGSALGLMNQVVLDALFGAADSEFSDSEIQRAFMHADFGKNDYSIITGRNAALVAGNKYEQGLTERLIDSEKDASNKDQTMWMPMAGIYASGVQDNEGRSDPIKMSGTPDFFRLHRDKDGKLRVGVVDAKATKTSRAILHGGFMFPGLEESDVSQRDLMTNVELRSAVPGEEMGSYTMQTGAYKWAFAEHIKNLKKDLYHDAHAKRKREFEKREDEMQAAEEAAGRTYTRNAYDDKAPVNDVDFASLSGEYAKSRYAKEVDKWALSWTASRTGIKKPENLSGSDLDKWNKTKEGVEYNRVFEEMRALAFESFQAIEEGRFDVEGIISPNVDQAGRQNITDEIVSDEGSLSIKPINSGVDVLTSVRQMPDVGEDSVSYFLKNYSESAQEMIEDVGIHHLGIMYQTLGLARRNKRKFLGLDPETGKPVEDLDGSDISDLFTEEVSRMKRGSTIKVDKSSVYPRRKEDLGVSESAMDADETAGTLAALQQGSTYRAHELATMERILRGYNRTMENGKVVYKKQGEAVVGRNSSGNQRFPVYDAKGTREIGDTELRQYVIAMSTDLASSGNTKTLNKEHVDASGIRRSMLEVVSGSVRDILNPVGKDEAEKLANQQKAFYNIYGKDKRPFSQGDVKNNPIEAMLQSGASFTSEQFAAEFSKMMVGKYEGEFGKIAPAFADIHGIVDWKNDKGGDAETGVGISTSQGALYYRVRKNITAYGVNEKIASKFGGIEAAMKAVARTAYAVLQMQNARKQDLPFTDRDLRGKKQRRVVEAPAEGSIAELRQKEAQGKEDERIAAMMDSKDGKDLMERLLQIQEEIMGGRGPAPAASSTVPAAGVSASGSATDPDAPQKSIAEIAFSRRITKNFKGANAFENSPDHREWFVSNHLRVMEATLKGLQSSAYEQIYMDPSAESRYQGLDDMDEEVLYAMLMGHDLMKARTTKRDKRKQEKLKKKGIKWDPEADKTPAYELALEMGLSEEKAKKVMDYLSMMDEVKTEEWWASNGDYESLPMEVRMMSTADALSHYTTGEKGFLNIFSSITDKLRGAARMTMDALVESNEKKVKKDKKKILMDITVSRNGNREIVKREDVLSDTEVAYNTATRETYVEGTATDFVHEAIEEFGDSESIKDVNVPRFTDATKRTWVTIDPKTKERKMFSPKGKGTGGKVEKGETDIVGEFGQEIIASGTDGELYVVPNSAIKREDSEQYRSQSRIKDQSHTAKAKRGSDRRKSGSVAGEVGPEVRGLSMKEQAKKKAEERRLAAEKKAEEEKAAAAGPDPADPAGPPPSVPTAEGPAEGPDMSIHPIDPTDPWLDAATGIMGVGSGGVSGILRGLGKIFGFGGKKGRKSGVSASSAPASSAKPAEAPKPAAATASAASPVSEDERAKRVQEIQKQRRSAPVAAVEKGETSIKDVEDDLNRIFPDSGDGSNDLEFAGHGDEVDDGIPFNMNARALGKAVYVALMHAGLGGGGGGAYGGGRMHNKGSTKWRYDRGAMETIFSEPAVDEAGNPIYRKNADGSLVKDKDGNPIQALAPRKDALDKDGKLNLGVSDETISDLLGNKQLGTAEAKGLNALRAMQLRGQRATLEDMSGGVRFLEEWIANADPTTEGHIIEPMKNMLNAAKAMRNEKMIRMGGLSGTSFSGLTHQQIIDQAQSVNKTVQEMPDDRANQNTKKSIQGFTDELTKAATHLKNLHENLQQLTATTKDSENTWKETAERFKSLGKWIKNAEEMNLRGELDGEGKKALENAKHERAAIQAQLMTGSDLHKASSELGEDHAKEMLSKYGIGGKGGKDATSGIISAHFMHEAVRAAREIFDPKFLAADRYAALSSKERSILAPVQQTDGQVNDTSAIYEAAKDNWNRAMGRNAATLMSGAYTNTAGGAIASSIARGVYSVGQSALGAGMFMANLASLDHFKGKIGSKGIFGAGAIVGGLDLFLEAYTNSRNQKEMVIADRIRELGGNVLGRDFMTAAGQLMTDTSNFFTGTRDAVETERVKMNQAKEVVTTKKSDLDSKRARLAELSNNAPDSVLNMLSDLSPDEINRLSNTQNSMMGLTVGQLEESIGIIDSQIDEFTNPGRELSPTEKSIVENLRETRKSTEAYLAARKAGVKDIGSIITLKDEINRGEGEVKKANAEYEAQRVTYQTYADYRKSALEIGTDAYLRMAPYDPKDNILDLIKGGRYDFSASAMSTFNEIQYGDGGMESASEYRRMIKRYGLSNDQAMEVGQYAQIIAGGPGTPIYTAAVTALAQRSSSGENLQDSFNLARGIGQNIGNYDYYSGFDYLIGRNFTGGLLSQAQMHGIESNTKLMGVSSIANVVSTQTGADYMKVVRNMQDSFVAPAMTPNVAQFKSDYELVKQMIREDVTRYNAENGTLVKGFDVDSALMGSIKYGYDVDRMPGAAFVTDLTSIGDTRIPKIGRLNKPFGQRGISEISLGAYRFIGALKDSVSAAGGAGVSRNAARLGFGGGLAEALISGTGGNRAGEIMAGLLGGDPMSVAAIYDSFNYLPTEIQNSIIESGITPAYDPTTGSQAMTKSMQGAVIRTPGDPYRAQNPALYQGFGIGSGPQSSQFRTIRAPIFDRKTGIEAYRRQAAAITPSVRDFFNQRSESMARSGLKSIWSSMGSSEQKYWSRVAAGEVVEVMVNGVPTPLAGPEAIQYVSNVSSANSQLASAGANLANLKLQRQFELDYERPMQQYQMDQRVAQFFGGKVASPFTKIGDLDSYKNMKREDREGIDPNTAASLNFGRGQYEYQRLERDIQLRDMQANFSQNMTRMNWQSEDLNRNRRRQLVQAGWQREDFDMQRAGVMLNRGMQMYNFGFEAREMGISQQAYREDFAYNQRMKQMQFGWQMEDADINIRRATGFERRQLIKQKERETISFNSEKEQDLKVNKRQEDAFKRQEEKFKKELEHYKKSIELEDQQFKIAVKRFEQQQDWEKEDYDIQVGRLAQERAWAEESFARQMERYTLEQEQFELQRQNEEILAKDQQTYQEAAWKLADEIYKNNLAAAGAAAKAAKDALFAAENMAQASTEMEKGMEAMTKFMTGVRWEEVSKAMDKIIAMYELINNSKKTPQQEGPVPLPAKAKGGRVDTSRSTLIGEYGPEILTIDGSGTPFVLPNSAIPKGKRITDQGQDQVIHIHVMMDSDEIATYTAGKANTLAQRNRRRAFNG